MDKIYKLLPIILLFFLSGLYTIKTKAEDYKYEIKFINQRDLGVRPAKLIWTMDEIKNRIFFPTSDGICVVDITTRAFPVVITTIPLWSLAPIFAHQVTNLYYFDNKLFAQCGEDVNCNYIVILDISNIYDTSLLCFMNTYYYYDIKYTKSLHFTPLDKTIFISSGREYITFWNISDPTNPEVISQFDLEEINGSWSDWIPSSGKILFHPISKYFLVPVFGIREIGLETRLILFNYSDVQNPIITDYTIPNHPLFGIDTTSYAKRFVKDDSFILTGTLSPPYRFVIALFDWTSPTLPTFQKEIVYNETDYFDIIGGLALNINNQHILSYYTGYPDQASFIIDLQNESIITEPNDNIDTIVRSTAPPFFIDDYIYCLDTVRQWENPGYGPIRVWQVIKNEDINNSDLKLYIILPIISGVIISIVSILVAKKTKKKFRITSPCLHHKVLLVFYTC